MHVFPGGVIEAGDAGVFRAEHAEVEGRVSGGKVDHRFTFRVLAQAGDHQVDLACGEGFYTRLYKLKGAAEVVGIDLSEQMIVLAKEAEKADPLGISYFVGNVLDLDLGKQFDLISASYFFLSFFDNCSLIAVAVFLLSTNCFTIAAIFS